MKFTFGIITYGQPETLMESILSIQKQNIPQYEIIVVGGNNQYENMEHVKHIDFDESIKDAWITRKKNIITENATYNNIVYMHDYVGLDQDWYNGFLRFGEDWDICMTVIKNHARWDGRYRDWVAWDDPDLCFPKWAKRVEGKAPETPGHMAVIVPYDYNKTEYMYINGAYWVAKKEVMENDPLDESLCWGQGEDVEWSKIIRDKYRYVMNQYSTVHILKSDKHPIARMLRDDEVYK